MYPDEFYEFVQMIEGIDEEMLLEIAGILLIVALVLSLLIVLLYVLQSVGLYSIAKRRGIANPWLAWLPVGNYWIAGSIADQYQYVAKGAVKNRRTILLALSLATVLISSLVGSVATGGFYLGTGKNAMHFAMLGDMGTAFDLIYSALELASYVFFQIVLYDLYTSCNPKNNVLFLVLGIFLPFLPAFFIFANRKKELGMPPRREQAPESFDPEMLNYEEPWKNE